MLLESFPESTSYIYFHRLAPLPNFSYFSPCMPNPGEDYDLSKRQVSV